MSAIAATQSATTKGMTKRGRSRKCGGPKHRSRRDEMLAHREGRGVSGGSKQQLRGGRITLRVQAVAHDLVDGVRELFVVTDEEFASDWHRDAHDLVEQRRYLKRSVRGLREQLRQEMPFDERVSLAAILTEIEHDLYGLKAIEPLAA